ncbi:MAG: metallophosphoesterase [Actinobacteria bacterium]|nr:metallophosphoesterase [Actinomycetota bacterium]
MILRRKTAFNCWWAVALAVFVLLAALLVYMFAEGFWIQVKQYEFASPEVPPEFDGATIVLLTDIHHGWFFSQDRVHDLVKTVNDLKPDIIALGGDYIYGSTDSKYEDSCFADLAHLIAPLGRFAVLGNHDYGSDPSAAPRAIMKAGIELLDNRGVQIEKAGAHLFLAGVDDLQVGHPDLSSALEGAAPSDLVILLSDNPDYAETLPDGAVDLMLSGHTHGGQVTLFGKWAPHLPSDYGQKYRTGVVYNRATTVIVSNGIGTIFPPMRFFAGPQIVQITLRHVGGL